MQSYTPDYYGILQDGSRRSAREVVPLVLELLRPASIVDVGCGSGGWLRAFVEHGISDILGVDGDYVESQSLEIEAQQFRAFDLSQPLRLERHFDLVMSLEVAEHLPPECAEMFVESLTRLGPVVLFSAAAPAQGGVQHLNEQWPSYWAALFQSRGFVAIDCLRSKVWNNDKVDYWYAQNMMLFVSHDFLDSPRGEELRRLHNGAHDAPLALAHPRKYLELAERLEQETRVAQWYIAECERHVQASDAGNMPLRKLLRALPGAVARAIRRRRA